MRADWVDKNPKAALAVLQAVLEAAQWCDKLENAKDELADIVGKRQWFNVPPADIINRIKGEVNYGDGRKINNRDLSMKFWRDHASYPFQSHELWFLTENQRWGMMPADLDTKAIIAKVNREDLWREAAKNIGVAEADIPARHVARQGDLLRRQGVRSGRSEGLSRLPADQEGGVMQAAKASDPSRSRRPCPCRAPRPRSCRSVRRAGRLVERLRERRAIAPASCCRR